MLSAHQTTRGNSACLYVIPATLLMSTQMMPPNDPNEGTGEVQTSQGDHQLAASLQAARRELRRKTRELEDSEAAREAAEDMLRRMIAVFDLASHDLRT